MPVAFSFAARSGAAFRRFLFLAGLSVAFLTGAPGMANGSGSGPETNPASTKATAVRGRVLNEEGKPLVGATVVWKGSPYGVSTDAEGSYLLPLAAGRSVIQFSYVGYADDEVTVRGGGTQNVTLLPVEPAAGTSALAGGTRRAQRSIK